MVVLTYWLDDSFILLSGWLIFLLLGGLLIDWLIGLLHVRGFEGGGYSFGWYFIGWLIVSMIGLLPVSHSILNDYVFF